MPPNTVWFVTGCSTGLGRTLEKRVLQQGHRCAVTARNPAQVEELVAETQMLRRRLRWTSVTRAK